MGGGGGGDSEERPSLEEEMSTNGLISTSARPEPICLQAVLTWAAAPGATGERQL